MRPTKYKIFVREEFSILKSCLTVNDLMDSTENSIEKESFENFENFEVLNRVWEIESFYEAIQIIHFRSHMWIKDFFFSGFRT